MANNDNHYGRVYFSSGYEKSVLGNPLLFRSKPEHAGLFGLCFAHVTFSPMAHTALHYCHLRMAETCVLTCPLPPSSTGSSRKEITEHWEWLEHNLLQTLSIFENENDITNFVKGKVQVT